MFLQDVGLGERLLSINWMPIWGGSDADQCFSNGCFSVHRLQSL